MAEWFLKVESDPPPRSVSNGVVPTPRGPCGLPLFNGGNAGVAKRTLKTQEKLVALEGQAVPQSCKVEATEVDSGGEESVCFLSESIFLNFD